ncbi:holo-ACP synthase [Vreelandella subglaciescola]|jgi:holo-[acyl-carrier protein] synthase|uniref:Holo-[acyl-carrier-protein] synthase n=1 Tax=Vreelandella subglaciescola TaxID=29571 RepID=A0A1M7EYY6_9GAMM|nr:holo-ACP synthase [Halomonas subglaciescola]SHL96698.1 holo-[acyl-carrier-protein] synthase [Halomonas subglaciescola]
MIIGIGSDIARVARFEAALERHGERFAKRLLGEDEQPLFTRHAHPAAFLAKRFAGKEAFVKALGLGFRRGMEWGEIQVLNDALGKPVLRLSGEAAEQARLAGVNASHVTLSDEAEYAVAFVVLER